MKTVKKCITFLLALTALLSVGGCKENKEATNDGVSATGEHVISEKPLDLTIHLHYYGTRVFDDDWAVFKEAANLTNVRLHGTASASVSDSKQAYSTMLTTKPLPDIIQYSCSELLAIGEQGALIPLEDLINEYAPNVKKILESSPEVRQAAYSDNGHIYCIPYLPAGYDCDKIPSMAWFIRQDWLDKLGLEQPKNVDEFYSVLKAFKTQDPNGNGKQDEIPFFSRQSSLNDLILLNGAYPDWNIDENGKVYYGPVLDEYKEAVKTIAKWYKEGLIDAEIFTRGKNSREILLSNDTGGCFRDQFSSSASFNDTLGDKIKDFKLVAMLPPADVNGTVKEFSKSILGDGYGWGISKDNKNPVETIKYFDFWASDTGQTLSAFGIEGTHYTVSENGEKKYTDTVLNNELSVPLYLVSQGCLMGIGTVGNYSAEYSGMNEIAQQGVDLYMSGDVKLQKVPNFVFNSAERKTNAANVTNITTAMNEQLQRWVLGVEDIDKTWDKYVSTIESYNFEEIKKNYQSAYDRRLSY